MAPPESARGNERSATHHYTMKTATRPPLSSSHSHHAGHHHPRHSHSNSQSFRPSRSTTTPTASPRMPHSVGQPYPPSSKISPGITAPDVRAPSPNYFALNVERTASSPRDSNNLPETNWSPPTSSVKSFGAAMPQQMALDANPEFEAFRRQADANRAKGFNLAEAHFGSVPALSLPSVRPKPTRRPTNHSDTPSEAAVHRIHGERPRDAAAGRMDVDADSLHDSAYVSSDSKRNSEISLTAPNIIGGPRFESPAHTDSPFDSSRKLTAAKVEERHTRLSLPQNQTEVSPEPGKPRAQTLPASLESNPSTMLGPALRDVLANAEEDELLLLDVRVSTHYAQARIRGALNLCIPTTLLKRATFDLQKLQKTLQTQEDQDKFGQWRKTKYLVVYDTASSEKRDATSAMNMLKKFANEGYPGNSYLLKGGFDSFSNLFPEFIDYRSAAERAGTSTVSSEGGRPIFAPVIGGVSLPPSSGSLNPFFSNIRQNMDLADGVGQLDLNLPPNIDLGTLPTWLKEVTQPSDHGKKVSEKFLKIEQGEQSRMKDAYAAFNASAASSRPGTIRLSGVEKGGKNRYKDILPFEHARVRLLGRDGACDYINASHIQASRSNKRYIASQGPLPATFEDFWSVIWDQDVRVIVMLTAESEGGQLKCHPYWRERDFGPIKLKPLSEKKVSLDIDRHRSSSTAFTSSYMFAGEPGRRRANTTTKLDSTPTPAAIQTQTETPYVTIRKFALSHTAHPFAPMREITHLHYPSWPDFGAPAQPSHLLALVELSNVMQRAALPVDSNAIAASIAAEQPTSIGWFDEPASASNKRPMLVHCSAGCGRTGTFCTVDSVIDMLKRQHLEAVEKTKQKDVDGDINMADEPISPRSKPPMSLGEQFTRPTHSRQALSLALPENGRGNQQDTTWIHDNTLDLIEATVEDFRHQRISMVQSLRQFVLCYETVVEWAWRIQEKRSASSSSTGRARSGSLETRR